MATTTSGGGYDNDQDEQGEGYEAPDKPSAPLDLDDYLQMFKEAYEADQPQARNEEKALKFQIPSNQWDPASRAAREGGEFGGVTVTARPILSVSKIQQPIDLVLASARSQQLGIGVHPISEDANPDVAEVFEGLVSRIQRDSDVEDAAMWALDRAVKCGRGYMLVTVRADEDADEDSPRAFDMELGVERILHGSCVYFDPTAQRKDLSDAEYVFIVSWVPAETFKRRYPKAKATAEAASSGLLFSQIKERAPLWVEQREGGRKAFMVAECYYKKHDTESLYLLGNGTITSDPPKGAEIINERVRDKVTVCRTELTAADILRHELWPSRYLPVVPLLGRELQPFDDQRRIEGMIDESAQDGQKFFNVAISNLVERMAAEPRSPWVMADGQDESHAEEWRLANVRSVAILHYTPVLVDGQALAPPPARVEIDSSGVSLNMQAAQFGGSLIQDATATYDPSLGRGGQQQESGRKVLALQSQADQATSLFGAGLERAVEYLGRILVDMIPRVYDAPGRIITILGGDDQKPKKVMLGRPYVMDNNAHPRHAKGAQVKDGRVVGGSWTGPQEPKFVDLRAGRYGVAATVGKKRETRLQEGGEQIGQLLQADPELAAIISDIWVRFLDLPGGTEIADRLKKFAQMKFPQLFADDQQDQGQQAQAENAALKQQLQQLGQQVQGMGQALQTKQVEQQAKVAMEQARAQADIEIARMNNATKVAVARISAAKGALDAQAEGAEEMLATGLRHEHEAQQAQLDRAHEVGMAAMQAHQQATSAAAQGARDGAAAAQQAAMAQQQAPAGPAPQADGGE